MPFYEVTVVASVNILVSADDEDAAVELAFENADFSMAGHKETKPARALTTDEVEQLRRLGDQVIES